MTIFAYKFVDANGLITTAQAVADNEAELIARLNAEDKKVVSVAVVVKPRNQGRIRPAIISVERQARVFDDLAILLNAGMQVDTALKALAASDENKVVKTAIENICSELSEGSSLTSAMRKTECFSIEAIALISAGEKTAKLPAVFSALAHDFSRRAKARKKLVEALIYPAFLILLAIAAILIITFFLVPALRPIFESANVDPPLIISTLGGLGETLSRFGILIGIIAAVIAILCCMPSSRTIISRVAEYIWLRLPYIGKLQKSIVLSRYFQSLSLLLENGVRVSEALQLAASCCSINEISKKLDCVKGDVENGARLPKALADTELFSESTMSLIAIGDEVNRLPSVIEKAGIALHEQVLRSTNRALAFLTPTITIVLGLIIGLLVVTVMTTLLSINELAIQ